MVTTFEAHQYQLIIDGELRELAPDAVGQLRIEQAPDGGWMLVDGQGETRLYDEELTDHGLRQVVRDWVKATA
jgi:hypothetical protein